MNSMTGFAHAEGQWGRILWSLDLKSYNNRYTDLVFSLPPLWGAEEAWFREQLGAALSRGRIELTLRLRELREQVEVRLNPEALDQALAVLGELTQRAGLEGTLGLEHLLAVPGVFSAQKAEEEPGLREAVRAAFGETLNRFQADRAREGAALQADLLKHLEVIRLESERLAAEVPGWEDHFRSSLERRFAELQAELEPTRVLSEVALLLVRYGINEELVRLKSHLELFSQLARETGPVGKKLDFLCQEIGREINTIGSKAFTAEVQHQVVRMKDALENLREQLRNVE